MHKNIFMTDADLDSKTFDNRKKNENFDSWIVNDYATQPAEQLLKEHNIKIQVDRKIKKISKLSNLDLKFNSSK